MSPTWARRCPLDPSPDSVFLGEPGPVSLVLSFLEPRGAISPRPLFRGRGSPIVSPGAPQPLRKRGGDKVQGVAHRLATPAEKWARARQMRRKPDVGGGAAVDPLAATAAAVAL